MPLLTLGKDGQIYEVDARFDGAQGIGRTAEMVDADDVTSLSQVEDKKALKDKIALRKLQQISHMNKVKKYATNMAVKKAKKLVAEKIN
jgi:predicted alpha/beta-hydrolase family hydrolase